MIEYYKTLISKKRKYEEEEEEKETFEFGKLMAFPVFSLHIKRKNG